MIPWLRRSFITGFFVTVPLVVSVAAMKDITAVLFTCGRKPDAAVLAEAESEGIVLLTTPLTTHQAAGKLWEAGLQ